MADENKGSGAVNIISGILNGLGGGNGIGDDVAQVIAASKTNQYNSGVMPYNGMYLSNGPTISPLMIFGGIGILVMLFLVLKK